MKLVPRQFTCLLILLSMILSLVACKTEDAHASKSVEYDSLFDLPTNFWSPFLGTPSENDVNSDGVNHLDLQDNGLDYVNYFIQAEQVINYCYSYHFVDSEKNSHLIENSVIILEKMMDTFHRNGKFPRPEYGYAGYEYGWVSSMDAPVIMLASLLVYELIGDENYIKFAEELIPYCTLDTSEGGFNFSLTSGGSWPLEYGREESEDDKNMYVLNGSLVGYLALLASNEILKSDALDDYLEKVGVAYKDVSHHYKNDLWTYYMLNPPKVIPIHYMIFEEKLFDAIYSLNDDAYFYDEYVFRRNLLNKVLRVEFYKNADGCLSYYQLRACPPNPYQIDCYPTEIEFLDENGTVVSCVENNISGSLEESLEEFYKGMFISGDSLSSECRSYRVYSNNGGERYLLFEDSVSVLESNSDKECDVIVQCCFDAIEQNGEIEISPLNDENKEEGDICFFFGDDIKIDNNVIVCIELDNMSDFDMATRLVLRDRDGNAASRYWTTLVPGKNVLPISPIGFTEISNLKAISELDVRLYEKDEQVSIKYGKVRIFNHYDTLYDYFNESEYHVHPQ